MVPGDVIRTGKKVHTVVCGPADSVRRMKKSAAKVVTVQCPDCRGLIEFDAHRLHRVMDRVRGKQRDVNALYRSYVLKSHYKTVRHHLSVTADATVEEDATSVRTDDLYCVQWLNVNVNTWEPEPAPLYKIGQGYTGREGSVHGQGPFKYIILKVWKGAAHLEASVQYHHRIAPHNKRWGAGKEWFGLDWFSNNKEVVAYIDKVVAEIVESHEDAKLHQPHFRNDGI